MSPEPRLSELTDRAKGFIEARDWAQFHNSKDLALSLSLEAAEVLELMQWKDGPALDEFLRANKNKLGEELADVLYWVLVLAYRNGIDLPAAFEAKMVTNEDKYPVDKAKGTSAKYTELG